MRRVLLIAASLMLGLLAVLLARTWIGMAPPLAPPKVARLELDTNALAARLAQALRVATISHSPAEPEDLRTIAQLHDLMRASFPLVFTKLAVETVAEGSLLITWPGTDPSLAPLLLLAHQDVVPIAPGTEGEWQYPPFSGAVEQGFIWGRGAIDDKAGLFGLLEAAELLLAQGAAPHRTVIFAFGHNEEVGGSGARAMAELLKSRGVRPQFVLDEGGMVTEQIVAGVETPAALVGVTEKGYLSVELTAQGPGGHSSMPGTTTNIGRLARAITKLEDHPQPLKVGRTLAASLRGLAPAMSFGRRVAIANLWLFAPLVAQLMGATDSGRATLHTTLAPTIFQAGIKDNVLPGVAQATINMRLIAGDSVDAALKRVEHVVGDGDIKIRALANPREPAPESDPAAPTFANLTQTIRQIFPDAIVAPYSTVGGTDATHYTGLCDHVYRFLPLRWRPDDQKRFHGSNERVSVESYADAVRFYVQLITNAAI